MTLFAHSAGDVGSVFQQALDCFCGGEEDPQSLAILAQLSADKRP